MPRAKTTPTTINPTTHVAETAKAALARIDAELAELRAIGTANGLAIAAKEAERAIYADYGRKPSPAFAAAGNGNQ